MAVVHPEAGNLGGGGFMVIRLADGTVQTLDYRETAPRRATRDMYLDSLGERYRAVARTPQLRATLELDDEPTLDFLAGELAREHRTDALALLDHAGAIVAEAGDASLLDLAPQTDSSISATG